MVKTPDSIADRLNGFVSAIGTFSEWMMYMQEQPLDLDLIELLPPDAEPTRASSGFFRGIFNQIRLFLRSFTQDYNGIDGIGAHPEIKVWLGGTGRDQANIIQQMITEDFSPARDIPVRLQFITGALLPSTLAGIGPDVYLFASASDPLNYAIRGAVEPLSAFADFTEITTRFSSESLIPYTYKNVTYALPETESFLMMFYRMDILSDLKIPVPETWDDIYNALSKLQSKNLTIGLPADGSAYYMYLYQNGGSLYRGGGEAVSFDDITGISAFRQWVDNFRDYSLYPAYNFINRFRTGEMAIGIVDFIFANQLSVSAPEIRGMWRIAPLPGVRGENGTINRSSPLGSVSNMIMKKSKHKEEAWEFLKWWSSASVQIAYSVQLEQILGVAGRYPTANREAFSKLAWPAEDAAAIELQRQNAIGVPEVPGSYIVPRYVNFAFSAVVDGGAEPGKTIMDYTEKINAELKRKRREFERK